MKVPRFVSPILFQHSNLANPLLIDVYPYTVANPTKLADFRIAQLASDSAYLHLVAIFLQDVSDSSSPVRANAVHTFKPILRRLRIVRSIVDMAFCF